ncbi:rhodanese-like domain-containing protein [Geomonas oryzae]|uniref:rhodanese-like domain-containing protein n=1 Tax=Geomonas oryzae TaxID=2364273 RepID=UPI0013A5F296|nr:rhodanese-like domain-containing protein [Geomonas oryzae]
MKKKVLVILMGLICFMLAAGTSFAAEGYPLRAKYAKLKYISTAELKKEYARAVIVDVRSKLEFDVIHITKAVNVPVAQKTFDREVKELRGRHETAPLVFYCNGHACEKSYEAAEQARGLGIENIMVYDAGIHDWVLANAEKTTLMGETPAQKSRLIPSDRLKSHKIKYAEFSQKVQAADAVCIDIREPFQRKEIPKLPRLRNIPSDRLVQLLAGSEFKGKTLLITDAVGKQVEWIQYYLEKYGIKNYYFLENGVLSARN